MRISDWSSDVCSSDLFDMERLEVLRGPQGTLYGRNATGGVINLITAKPELDRFEGSIKGEVGNYDSRRMTGMLNVPIVADQLGLRVAGSMTDRDGYDYNSVTQNSVNGRDLWSLRTTLGFRSEEHTSELPSLMRHHDAGLGLNKRN